MELRHAVYVRDGHVCVWCAARVSSLPGPGERQATLDHLHPEGHPLRTNAPEGVLTCCAECNSSRQDEDVLAWLLRLCSRADVDVRDALSRLSRRLLPVSREAGAVALRLAREEAARRPPEPLGGADVEIPF